MATNFPTSLDTFTNPNSGNTLDSPSHSIQHSDANDALEAIEAKVGVGSSTAGSATEGYALVNTSGGTTAYSLLGVAGLSSGTAVANTVLTANGSSGATFAPVPSSGLSLLIPSSVTVGSGTGSVSATGTVTFSGASSVSVNDVFSATYDNYKILINVTSSLNEAFAFRYRVSGADNTTANYHQHIAFVSSTSSSYSGANYASATNFFVSSSNGANSVKGIDLTIYKPFASAHTLLTGLHSHSAASGAGNYNGGHIQGGFSATTSFTGFSVFPNSGTITGSISVFGVNK